jgi:hypothetical protein
MARPIAPTPTLKGEAARRFVEAALDKTKYPPIKTLTRKQVDKFLDGILDKKDK